MPLLVIQACQYSTLQVAASRDSVMEHIRRKTNKGSGGARSGAAISRRKKFRSCASISSWRQRPTSTERWAAILTGNCWVSRVNSTWFLQSELPSLPLSSPFRCDSVRLPYALTVPLPCTSGSATYQPYPYAIASALSSRLQHNTVAVTRQRHIPVPVACIWHTQTHASRG
jgi:hypothetical protein